MFPPNTIPVYDRTDDPDVEMLCAGQFPAEPVEWLWPNRIPIGKVTLLIGDPGTGKSLVALDIAARVTSGAAWPEEGQGDKERGKQGDVVSQTEVSLSPCLPLSPSNEPPPATSASPVSTPNSSPASVLILSAEDDLRDTIRPRLDAAGADADRVFVLPAIADLRHDFPQLEAAVNRARDCRLIIIDPINAYVGSGDCHFHTVVHKVLAPLAKLAAERRIAVVAIAHVRKADRDVLFRATGSMGFITAARAVWTVCRDPEHPARHFLLPLKLNVARTTATHGLAYSIEPHPDLPGPKLVWATNPVTVTIAEALKPRKPVPPASERSSARDWLREVLSAGPRRSSEVIEEGEERGFLRRTLQRAFHELKGCTRKKGLMGGWWWSLGDQSPEDDSPDPTKSADIFEDVTYEIDVALQEQVDKAHKESTIRSPPPDIRPTTRAGAGKEVDACVEANIQTLPTTPHNTGSALLDRWITALRPSPPKPTTIESTSDTS